MKCQAWGLAPRTGGMDDQDYMDITRMDLLQSVYNAIHEWRTGKMSPQASKMVNWLAKEGLMK